MTTYFFVDKLPKKKSGVYAHYDHQIMQENFWEQLDVRKYIQSQEHSWVMQTQKWHTKLSRTALQLTEWWWLHQASKLVTWNLPVFKPFFFSIAIIELTKNRSIEQLYLLNCPQIIADYIQDLSPNNQCVQSKITKKSFREKSNSSLGSTIGKPNSSTSVSLKIECFPKSLTSFPVADDSLTQNIGS